MALFNPSPIRCSTVFHNFSITGDAASLPKSCCAAYFFGETNVQPVRLLIYQFRSSNSKQAYCVICNITMSNIINDEWFDKILSQ